MSLIREPNGCVVLRSGDTALRFFPEWGGVPLEFWKDNFPLLTNPAPGSGTSINWEMGQDPTQASCDGLTPHQIARIDDPASIKYNYYAREQVFSEADNFYQVSGFAPDFWLSHEHLDDYAIGTWYTKYNDPKGLGFWDGPSSTVCAASPGCLFPGNEIYPNHSPRSYDRGRFAGKVTVNMVPGASSTDRGGITFRNGEANTKRSGYDFTVYATGKYRFERRDNTGKPRTLAQGYLNKAEYSRLWRGGVELEVRTDNGAPGLALLIDGRSVAVVIDTKPLRGPFCGLTARTNNLIGFSYRQFFDLSTQFTSSYSIDSSGNIYSQMRVDLAGGVPDPAFLYRANLPGIFLHPTSFPVRSTKRFKDGQWVDAVGLVPCVKGDSFWCGSPDGSYGVKAQLLDICVDDRPAYGAHVQLDPNGANGEFVMQFNPLPASLIYPRPIRSVSTIIRWKTNL